MPLFIGAVLLLSFLLLMTVFHSIVVAAKAVVMNMLSIAAAFGALVAVFQWGFGDNLIGLGREGPIEAWAPMMLFAIVFGLSMDYEVFLLTRIREEYDRTGDNAQAVADGLAATGRVITAAAAIMICVFGAFVLGEGRDLKLLGFGLAFAIFIDATLVRLVLVPAVMELMGKWNWYLPSWLRWLPDLRVEPEELRGPQAGRAVPQRCAAATDARRPGPTRAARTFSPALVVVNPVIPSLVDSLRGSRPACSMPLPASVFSHCALTATARMFYAHSTHDSHESKRQHDGSGMISRPALTGYYATAAQTGVVSASTAPRSRSLPQPPAHRERIRAASSCGADAAAAGAPENRRQP